MSMFQESFIRLAQAFNYKPLPTRAANNGLLQTTFTIVLGIAGIIAVMMVVIGGIQYASSQGDPKSTSRAKQTILYALVGLILAIFARIIVGYVFDRVVTT
jgi:hypothetical protein